MWNSSLYEHESSNPGPDLASFSGHSAVVSFESSKTGFSFKRQRPFCKNEACAKIVNCSFDMVEYDGFAPIAIIRFRVAKMGLRFPSRPERHFR